MPFGLPPVILDLATLAFTIAALFCCAAAMVAYASNKGDTNDD